MVSLSTKGVEGFKQFGEGLPSEFLWTRLVRKQTRQFFPAFANFDKLSKNEKNGAQIVETWEKLNAMQFLRNEEIFCD